MCSRLPKFYAHNHKCSSESRNTLRPLRRCRQWHWPQKHFPSILRRELSFSGGGGGGEGGGGRNRKTADESPSVRLVLLLPSFPLPLRPSLSPPLPLLSSLPFEAKSSKHLRNRKCQLQKGGRKATGEGGASVKNFSTQHSGSG